MPRPKLSVPNFRLRNRAGTWVIDWTEDGRPRSKSCRTSDRLDAEEMLERVALAQAPQLLDPVWIAALKPRLRPLHEPVVYFVGNEANALIKIGRTISGHVRLKSLQIGSPVRLFVVREIDCPTPAWATALETAMHRWFASERRIGEWHAVTMEQIDDLLAREPLVVIGGIAYPRALERVILT